MTHLPAPLVIDTRRLLDGLGDAVVVADDDGVIVHLNHRAETLFGASRTDLVGRPLVTLVPERLRPRHLAGFRRYQETGAGRLVDGAPVRLPALRADGSEVEVELLLTSHVGDDGRRLLLGSLRDLADRVELERQRDIGRYLVTSREVMARLALTAEASSLEEAAPLLLEALGHGLGWDGGAIWMERDGTLAAVAGWSRGGQELAEDMTAGVRFGRGEGVPGRVLEHGEPEWIEAVAGSQAFLRQDCALRTGVRSVFAFPIIVGGQVGGVVEMYSRATQLPEPEFLAVLQSAGLEIGRYLERAQARRHLVEMAEALQASLLPPRPPTIPGLDVAVRYRAAAGEGQVGGDFFDVFPLPDGAWAVLIGDVSGRGPRAAALTALARYTLRAAAVGSPSPSAVLRVLNDVVRQELEAAFEGDERFLTVAYLNVGPAAGGCGVTVACAGHPRPLARRRTGQVEEIRCQGELIGAFEAHEAADQAVRLLPGDALVLVTDGILEARDGSDQFGEERLRGILARTEGASAAATADAIEEAVLAHTGGRGQDDMALVVLRLPAGPAPAADMRVAELRVAEAE